MLNLLGLVLPGWAKWLAIAAAALALYAFGRFDGERIKGIELADYKAEQATAAIRVLKARVEVLHDVEVRYVQAKAQIVTQIETIIQEVPTYVTAADNAACVVPAGFVRVHDAGWSGEDPAPAGVVDREPAGVSLAQVAETSVWNAGACRQWREQALKLREAYERVRQAGP